MCDVSQLWRNQSITRLQSIHSGFQLYKKYLKYRPINTRDIVKNKLARFMVHSVWSLVSGCLSVRLPVDKKANILQIAVDTNCHNDTMLTCCQHVQTHRPDTLTTFPHEQSMMSSYKRRLKATFFTLSLSPVDHSYVVIIHHVRKKVPFIFDYYSHIPRSIFIIFVPLETGMIL